MIHVPPMTTSSNTPTATSSSEGGAVRLARLGHPYPGLEAFAAGVTRPELRCEEGLVAGCPRRGRGCASEGVGRPNSSHAARGTLLSRNCTVEPRWAMIRAMRAAFENGGAEGPAAEWGRQLKLGW